MPSGDGINLIEHIKDKSDTPVIMLTAMGEDISKIQGLKTGADDYVAKPFEPEELYLRIENFLKLYDNINQFELHKIYAVRYKSKLLKIPISLLILNFIVENIPLPKIILNFFLTISSQINYDNSKIRKELNFYSRHSLKKNF